MVDEHGQAGDDFDNALRPYRKLDTAKRARAGLVYLVLAIAAGALAVASGVWALWLTAAGLLVALAVHQFLGAWRMKVTDMEAIRIAADTTSFDFGHGSATLGFRGFRARPVWQVLVFGDGPAPRHQALVTIDAVSSDITGIYEESVVQP